MEPRPLRRAHLSPAHPVSAAADQQLDLVVLSLAQEHADATVPRDPGSRWPVRRDPHGGRWRGVPATPPRCFPQCAGWYACLAHRFPLDADEMDSNPADTATADESGRRRRVSPCPAFGAPPAACALPLGFDACRSSGQAGTDRGLAARSASRGSIARPGSAPWGIAFVSPASHHRAVQIQTLMIGSGE